MYRPKVVKARLNTNKPIDVLEERYKGQGLTKEELESIVEANKLFKGLIVYLSLWDYDNYTAYHLYGWDSEIDEIMMLAMYHSEQTSPLQIYLGKKEEFISDWKSNRYEPDCAFTFEIEDVEVIEVIQEEINEPKKYESKTNNS